MNKLAILSLLTAVSALGAIPRVFAADDPIYKFEQGYPAAGTSKQARDDADLQRAMVAYRFWYPTVSAEGILNGNRAVGIKDNEAIGIAAAGPRQVGFTLNSDTPYGSATLDVSKGPVVVELPPGGFIGLVNDHNQGWVLDLGIPGPDAGKGGKHLIIGPDYKGKIPKGYFVGRTPTYKNMLALRALPIGGDQEKGLKALREIKVYPLANPKQRLTFVDTTTMDMDSSSLKWEDNILFWQKLSDIIQQEPLNEKFLPMYGLLQALGIEKGREFKPDARMTAILGKVARDGRDQMLVSAFDSDRPDRFAWQDRKWEWAGLIPNSAQFETPGGIDLEARDRWFAQAIVTSPAMFRRNAGAGSLYWLGARDGSGAWLDGGKAYKLSIPQPVPNELFWSVTVYDAQTRSEVQTDQGKASLRSLFELKDAKGPDPTVLYFGPNAPQGQDGRWIKTVPGRGWFAYIRIYGPKKPAFDGSWKPGDFEEIK